MSTQHTTSPSPPHHHATVRTLDFSTSPCCAHVIIFPTHSCSLKSGAQKRARHPSYHPNTPFASCFAFVLTLCVLLCTVLRAWFCFVLCLALVFSLCALIVCLAVCALCTLEERWEKGGRGGRFFCPSSSLSFASFFAFCALLLCFVLFFVLCCAVLCAVLCALP